MPALKVAGFDLFAPNWIIDQSIAINTAYSALCNSHSRILGVMDVSAVLLAKCTPVDGSGLTHAAHPANQPEASCPLCRLILALTDDLSIAQAFGFLAKRFVPWYRLQGLA